MIVDGDGRTLAPQDCQAGLAPLCCQEYLRLYSRWWTAGIAGIDAVQEVPCIAVRSKLDARVALTAS